MKRSSTGWPIDFTDNELKMLYILADDKGHSEKEIAERMVDKEQYQVVYSKSLSDVDNVSKVLGELYENNVVYYESRNEPREKANRDYSVKFYRIYPRYYMIIRDITKRLEEEAHWRTFKLFEKGVRTQKSMIAEEDKNDEKEGLYHYVHEAFKYMVYYHYGKDFVIGLTEGEYQYWSPALSKVKKLVNLIKPYCDIPKIGQEDAYAEIIVLMLRPELHEDHLKWLKENLEDSNLRYKEPCHLTKKSQV
jgi:hypothetical protein